MFAFFFRCVAMVVFLAGMVLAAGAGEEVPPLPVPYVPDRPVDASAWPDDVGLVVAALSDPDADPAHPTAVAAGFRAGWNEKGLRLLVTVRDETPRELHPAWQGDSVEFFVAQDAEKGRHRLQFILAPGRDGGLDAEPRMEFYDARPAAFRALPSQPSYAARATDHGYRVELTVPWADLDVKPEAGRTLGLQIEVNDHVDGRRVKPRLHPRPAGGSNGERPMRAIRLVPAGPVAPVRAVESRTQTPDNGLIVRFVADGAWAGRAAAVRLDGHDVGELTFGPDRAGWTDGVFQLPPNRIPPQSRQFEVTLPDGSTYAFPHAVVLPCPITIAEGMRGENYPLNGALRYLMERLGEDTAFYTYRFFTGVTGEAFVQVHTRHAREWADSITDGMRTEEDFRPVFDACGYDFILVRPDRLAADPDAWRRAIVAEIDRGAPAIYKPLGDAPAVINGYENGGETLLGRKWSQTRSVPVAAPIAEWRYLLLAGEKKDEPMERAEIFNRALDRIPALLTRPEHNGTRFGNAAYQRWADDLADPARHANIAGGEWSEHGAWYCLTLTNESHRLGFLAMAQRYCPDRAPQIEALRAAHERMRELHRQMEQIGAGFDLRNRALKDPQAMETAIGVIRRMGEVSDLTLAWFNDPALAKTAEAEPPAANTAPAEVGDIF